jgi:YggT family protein
MQLIVQVINIITQCFVLLVFVWALLSWVVPPENPVRRFLDRIVEPILGPIRRVVPLVRGVDLSPIVLIIIVMVLNYLLSLLLVR